MPYWPASNFGFYIHDVLQLKKRAPKSQGFGCAQRVKNSYMDIWEIGLIIFGHKEGRGDNWDDFWGLLSIVRSQMRYEHLLTDD